MRKAEQNIWPIVPLMVLGVAAACLVLLATTARAGSPWNGDGHCQYGAVYDPTARPSISITESGHLNRQCNDTSTASHGFAGGTYILFRTTGSADYRCNFAGTKCGYRFYLDNYGWTHCAWTTGSCS